MIYPVYLAAWRDIFDRWPAITAIEILTYFRYVRTSDERMHIVRILATDRKLECSVNF